jgi:hypothetical protein
MVAGLKGVGVDCAFFGVVYLALLAEYDSTLGVILYGDLLVPDLALSEYTGITHT